MKAIEVNDLYSILTWSRLVVLDDPMLRELGSTVKVSRLLIDRDRLDYIYDGPVGWAPLAFVDHNFSLKAVVMGAVNHYR